MNTSLPVCVLQETLYIGGQDTRMQAFKLPLIMDAPATVAVTASRAALNGLADGPLPGAPQLPAPETLLRIHNSTSLQKDTWAFLESIFQGC